MKVLSTLFKSCCFIIFLYQSFSCLDQFLNQDPVSVYGEEKQENHLTPVICFGLEGSDNVAVVFTVATLTLFQQSQPRYCFPTIQVNH